MANTQKVAVSKCLHSILYTLYLFVCILLSSHWILFLYFLQDINFKFGGLSVLVHIFNDLQRKNFVPEKILKQRKKITKTSHHWHLTSRKCCKHLLKFLYSRVELFDFHHFAKSALTQGCQYFDCGKRTEQFIKIKSSREIRENISEF